MLLKPSGTARLGAGVTIEKVSKRFGTFQALESVSLEVEGGSFVTILGPSGSGKTTLLRVIGGFELPSSGRVVLDGEDITYLPPERRNVSTSFQGYALFPHMTVRQNVAFGLETRKVPRPEIERRVAEALDLVRLGSFGNRDVTSLSGGEQQRIALARAFVNRPKLLLLDEPLSALDLKLRRQMQIELKAVQRTLGITFIYVTHDQEEALSMSDRIVVINRARIEQVGTPDFVYRAPRTAFVADFLGESNILAASVKGPGETQGFAVVELAGHCFQAVDRTGCRPGNAVSLSLRPESVAISDSVAGEGSRLQGTLVDAIFLGNAWEFVVAVGDLRIKAWMPCSQLEFPPGIGTTVTLAWRDEDLTVVK